MAGKEIAVKKYVVRLSAEEREQLDELIRKGKRSAQLLKGPHPIESRRLGSVVKAGATARLRRRCRPASIRSRGRARLVEEGLEAALTRKHSPNSARRRIFDGAAEARLIALASSKPPDGRARWTLQLLEEKVVELKIVERASDNTIGRTLKKTLSSRI